MAREVPQGLEFVAEVVPFGGEPVFDSQSGENVQTLLPTDGSIVPMGAAVIIAVDLLDGRKLLGHTTFFFFCRQSPHVLFFRSLCFTVLYLLGAGSKETKTNGRLLTFCQQDPGSSSETGDGALTEPPTHPISKADQ